MALTNFILIVAGVGPVILLAISDIKQSATIFRRNIRQICNWVEEESVAASKRLQLKNDQLSVPAINFCITTVVEVLGSVATVDSDLVKRILPFITRKHRVKRSIKVPAISNKVADIPLDEYSWRKYGHNPIKGSPCPR